MNISAIASPQPAGLNDDTRRQAKLADAAHQFEGMFLQELLKPMQSKNSLTGEDKSGDDSSDPSADTLQSYGTEAVAKAISAQGGFGIARQVIQKLNRSTHEHQNTQKDLATH